MKKSENLKEILLSREEETRLKEEKENELKEKKKKKRLTPKQKADKNTPECLEKIEKALKDGEDSVRIGCGYHEGSEQYSKELKRNLNLEGFNSIKEAFDKGFKASDLNGGWLDRDPSYYIVVNISHSNKIDKVITVYVTKNALTDGILEKKVKISPSIGYEDTVFDVLNHDCFKKPFWHKNKVVAIAYAEKMKFEEINSLKEKIKKIEEIKFE